MSDAETAFVREPRCESCGFAGPTTNYPGPLGVRAIQICELCSGTIAGMWNQFPEGKTLEHVCLAEAICFVGNKILAAIAELKPAKREPEPAVIVEGFNRVDVDGQTAGRNRGPAGE